jgi:hypothetical protein
MPLKSTVTPASTVHGSLTDAARCKLYVRPGIPAKLAM